jgi:hypothetical protein
MEVNGQTALSTRLRAANTVLVSRMGRADLADLGIETSATLESAVAEACRRLQYAGTGRIRCILLEHALHTVPFVTIRS